MKWFFRHLKKTIQLQAIDDKTWMITKGNCKTSCSLSDLKDMLAKTQSNIMIDENRDRNWIDYFLAGGLSIQRIKVLFEKDLTQNLPELTLKFTSKSLSDLGYHTFLNYMILGSKDDPETNPNSDHATDFQALIECYGHAFKPQNWQVVFLKEQAIGVVLPQCYPDQPTEGTLSYLAILPESRGKGLGQSIHLFGLHQLKKWGVKRYIGSTSNNNTGMIKIFKKNDCKELFKRYFIC